MLGNPTVENLLFKYIKKSCQQYIKKNYVSGLHNIVQNEIKRHPYRKIHPWKSLEDFTNDLLNNVIYNKDGLVALNKPYGISSMRKKFIENKRRFDEINAMANPCDYCISDSLPQIADKLGYSELQIIKGPERYMSGVTLLAKDEKVLNAAKKSAARTIGLGILPSTYWVITTRLPIEIKGKQHLAIKLQQNKSEKKAVILKKWSENERKRLDVKIFNVEFKVLSNSTQNLSSLIEIQASTRKWHAIRLFAATVLHSPILGDNFYGSRIQKIMNAYLPVDPFLECTKRLPKLEKPLLQLLHLTQSKQEIIPAHIHLRKLHLSGFLGPKKDLIIEAPLLPPFDWTCEQLQFKYIQKLSENDAAEEMTNKDV